MMGLLRSGRLWGYMAKSLAPLRAGDRISVETVWTDSSTVGPTSPQCLVDGAGMTSHAAQEAVHDNAADGSTMWLSRGTTERPVSITFDFGGTYPLGEMWVWNYNQYLDAMPGLWKRGMHTVAIDWSLDGIDWTHLDGKVHGFEMAPADGRRALQATNLLNGHEPIRFHNQRCRFVRMTVMGAPGVGNWGGVDGEEPFYGLSAVQFYVGTGWVMELDGSWTSLFHCRSGWAGADGIYSLPLEDTVGSIDKPAKSFCIFGDTFVGPVDPATDKRFSMVMINNSAAVIEGKDPGEATIKFLWNQDEGPEGPKDESLFVPRTERGRTVDGSYYWLQAGARVAQKFHCLPMIIGPNPDGPEGFQFAVHGVTMVSVPIRDGNLQWNEETQCDTELYRESSDGVISYFGAGIFDNQSIAGDGFVYIYGLRNEPIRSLLVARVTPEAFETVTAWKFWNGHDWAADMNEAAPIVHGVSSELSVCPLRLGPQSGYVLIHGQGDLRREYVCASFAPTPYGPFSPAERLYYCAESAEGDGVYAYNPKAHSALSAADADLLISYNVNTTSWDTHVYHAEVYRPRFVRMRWIDAAPVLEEGSR